uniref:GNAT family N-acetyltransferase n=1 Tax=Rhodoblastus sp. TaxID=1962975 RepID=UPI0035B21F22
DVEDIWRQAQENCACYGFQTFEWLSTWQATIGDAEGIKPHIVQVADRSGNTLMLLPLGIQRRFGLSLLKFLGGDATDYHAPIVRTVFAAALGAAGLDRLMARVMEQLPPVDVIDFEKMPLKIEDATNPLAALPGVEHVHNAHIATLGATFDAFKERRSKKFFRTGDRRWRQLSRIAPVHFCICNANEALTNIISILISQKRRMYWKTGCRDLFDNPRLHRFYTSLAQNNLSTGLIQTSSLCVGETVAAAHIGMVFRGRFYWILPSYDADNWARYSPGRLLMQNLIEWSISAGLKTFDLTIGDEDYKRLWADHTVPLYQFTSGLTVTGKIYLLIRTAGGRLRAFARQRPWLAACVRAWRRHKSSSRFR